MPSVLTLSGPLGPSLLKPSPATSILTLAAVTESSCSLPVETERAANFASVIPRSLTLKESASISIVELSTLTLSGPLGPSLLKPSPATSMLILAAVTPSSASLRLLEPSSSKPAPAISLTLTLKTVPSRSRPSPAVYAPAPENCKKSIGSETPKPNAVVVLVSTQPVFAYAVPDCTKTKSPPATSSGVLKSDARVNSVT